MKSLQILKKILILSAVFLIIGFYVSLKNGDNNQVLIKEDHTTKMKSTPAQNSDYKTGHNPVEKPKEGAATWIGKDISLVEKELGTPQRIDETLYGFQWYIYNQDYSRYLQIGVKNNRVVTVYALGESLDVAPFEIGQPVEEIFNTLYFDTGLKVDLDGSTYRIELNDTDLNVRPLVQLGDIYAQLYIDKFSGTLSSVRFLDAETLIEQRPYELVYKGKLLKPAKPSDEMWKIIEKGSEQEIFDITNALRIRNQLKPLIWDEITAEAAYQHSKDMAVNNDFSHDSKKYGTLTDRLNKAKVVFQSAGENIAANYTDGPEAVAGWLNSESHRDALFSKTFTHVGIGVYQKYYTQNFIQKKAE